MSSTEISTEKWRRDNSHKLVDCQWGCSLSLDACKKYQARCRRYVIHFNGTRSPLSRVNAEYVKCLYPEPCAYLISDEEAAEIRAVNGLSTDQGHKKRRKRLNRAKEWDRFVNPDHMLEEEDWNRSLIRV